MDGVAAAIESNPEDAKELAELSERRAEVDGELSHLRTRLGLLRQRTRELRAAIPQPGLG